jgi:uncharacterized alkaline shock family protein YloU
MRGDDIARTVMDVDGVLDIADGRQKGIRVTNSERGLHVDINVILKFGMRIPETAWQLQQRVKETIDASAAEYGDGEIDRIDIHIRGIRAV